LDNFIFKTYQLLQKKNNQMNNPSLKGEVSINKMLSQKNPGLRRNDVMFHCFVVVLPTLRKNFPGLQIHFFAPAKPAGDKAPANFAKFNSGGATAPSHNNNSKELNFEDGNSSLGFKAEVSLPLT
jgi:hypothetical protein